MKSQRSLAYPRKPQQKNVAEVPSIINRNGCFFEGRQTQNSEDNIELGDGGDMTSVVSYFMGWLFFEEPGIMRNSQLTVLVID